MAKSRSIAPPIRPMPANDRHVGQPLLAAGIHAADIGEHQAEHDGDGRAVDPPGGEPSWRRGWRPASARRPPRRRRPGSARRRRVRSCASMAISPSGRLRSPRRRRAVSSPSPPIDRAAVADLVLRRVAAARSGRAAPPRRSRSSSEPMAAMITIGPAAHGRDHVLLGRHGDDDGDVHVDQNSTPSLMPGRACPGPISQDRAAMSRIMAMPTPPTLAFTPRATPRRSPRNTPMRVQSASSATPKMVIGRPRALSRSRIGVSNARGMARPSWVCGDSFFDWVQYTVD